MNKNFELWLDESGDFEISMNSKGQLENRR